MVAMAEEALLQATTGDYLMTGPAIVYTTSKCGQCRSVKQYLEHLGVPYEVVNLEGDMDAMRLVQDMTGRCTAPTIHIGNRWLVGYRPIEIKEAAET